MTEIRIQEICNRCNGTGADDRFVDSEGNPVPETCGFCEGDGWIEGNKLDVTEIMDAQSDIMDRCDDILDKCNDIFEKVNE